VFRPTGFAFAALLFTISGCDFYGDAIGGNRADGGGTGGFGGFGGFGGAGGSAGGAGGSGGGIDPGTSGLPCDVAAVLDAYCARCHGATLSGGAPMRLATRDDLMRDSATYPGTTDGQRSLARMQAGTMPPAPSSGPNATELSAFDTWVTGGMPAGTCQTNTGGSDGGLAALTCASALITWKPIAGDPKGGPTMAPGLACAACHSGQNFQNQNPNNAMNRTDQVYDAMGTVFPALHEQDLCFSDAGSGGVRVEILAMDSGIKATMAVNSAGNFYGNVNSGLPNPYTARVTRGTSVIAMSTAQTTGDCNSCHTEQGLNGAPGRIVAP
jgi:cytochrome c553